MTTIVGINFAATRRRWHGHILRWSNSAQCVLRTVGQADRPCVACIMEYTPRERQGQMVNPEARKAVVSALAPDAVTPVVVDQEGTTLVVFNPDGTEQPPYRIVSKPGREEPTPGLTIFWTLQVRR